MSNEKKEIAILLEEKSYSKVQFDYQDGNGFYFEGYSDDFVQIRAIVDGDNCIISDRYIDEKHWVLNGCLNLKEWRAGKFELIAEQLCTRTFIANHYFLIGSLFLRNVSLSADPDRHQEYEVYKLCELDETYYQIESLTVTMYKDYKQLAKDLIGYDTTSISEMVNPFSNKPIIVAPLGNEKFPSKNIEVYQKAFEEYQKQV